jgi:hypothetical protein
VEKRSPPFSKLQTSWDSRNRKGTITLNTRLADHHKGLGCSSGVVCFLKSPQIVWRSIDRLHRFKMKHKIRLVTYGELVLIHIVEPPGSVAPLPQSVLYLRKLLEKPFGKVLGSTPDRVLTFGSKSVACQTIYGTSQWAGRERAIRDGGWKILQGVCGIDPESG